MRSWLFFSRFFWSGRFLFGRLACGAERFFTTLVSASFALGAFDDVDDDFAIVFAAFRAGAMRDTESATLAFRGARG